MLQNADYLPYQETNMLLFS